MLMKYDYLDEILGQEEFSDLEDQDPNDILEGLQLQQILDSKGRILINSVSRYARYNDGEPIQIDAEDIHGWISLKSDSHPFIW